MEPITRRQFTVAAGLTLALTVLPTDLLAQKRKKDAPLGEHEAGDLATEPFVIGALADYRQPGLYNQQRGKGVWVVSDGQKLIVLSSVCTHNGCPVGWDPKTSEFSCPCHHSRFTQQGINVDDQQKAKRPLERCHLSLVDTDKGQQVQVDPTKRFVKYKDKDEFGETGAYLLFN